jgi:hypothetical protein
MSFLKESTEVFLFVRDFSPVARGSGVFYLIGLKESEKMSKLRHLKFQDYSDLEVKFSRSFKTHWLIRGFWSKKGMHYIQRVLKGLQTAMLSRRRDTEEYRVATIFPEHFQS